MRSKITDIENIMNDIDNPDCNVDNIVNDFSLLLHNVSYNFFGKSCKKKTFSRRESPWFNQECKACKTDFTRKLKKYRTDRSGENRDQLMISKMIYCKMKRNAKNKFLSKEKENIKQLA